MKRVSDFGIKLLLLLTTAFLAAQANAETAYQDYIADIQKLESEQSRAPKPVITYGDPKNGALLKSVLSPTTFKQQLDNYLQASAGGKNKNVPNVLTVLGPVLNRYEQAFESEPKKYEAEFLDGFEISSLMLKTVHRQMTEPRPERKANPNSNVSPEDQKKLDETLVKLQAAMVKMSESMMVAVADGMRKRVEKGELSPAGAKRALALADNLSPKAK